MTMCVISRIWLILSIGTTFGSTYVATINLYEIKGIKSADKGIKSADKGIKN